MRITYNAKFEAVKSRLWNQKVLNSLTVRPQTVKEIASGSKSQNYLVLQTSSSSWLSDILSANFVIPLYKVIARFVFVSFGNGKAWKITKRLGRAQINDKMFYLSWVCLLTYEFDSNKPFFYKQLIRIQPYSSWLHNYF